MAPRHVSAMVDPYDGRMFPGLAGADVHDDNLGHLVEAIAGGVGELGEAEHVEAVVAPVGHVEVDLQRPPKAVHRP